LVLGNFEKVWQNWEVANNWRQLSPLDSCLPFVFNRLELSYDFVFEGAFWCLEKINFLAVALGRSGLKRFKL
jgi:hypothetical protein